MSAMSQGNDREETLWEGGDPPCWAHLFEDEEASASLPADGQLIKPEAPELPRDNSTQPT